MASDVATSFAAAEKVVAAAAAFAEFVPPDILLAQEAAGQTVSCTWHKEWEGARGKDPSAKAQGKNPSAKAQGKNP